MKIKKKPKVLSMPVFVKEDSPTRRKWREWQAVECDKIEAKAKEKGELDKELQRWLSERREAIEKDLEIMEVE